MTYCEKKLFLARKPFTNSRPAEGQEFANAWDHLNNLFEQWKISTMFNRRWHISTTPSTTKIFCTLFKLIQPSNMVTLSCLAKKNQNLNPRKKKFSLLLKDEFSYHKLWEISISWPRVQNPGHMKSSKYTSLRPNTLY